MLITETTKALISRKILESIGLSIVAYSSEEPDKVLLKKRVTVVKTTRGNNQMDYVEAKALCPSVKIGDILELDYEGNDMVDCLINSAIKESSEAEALIEEQKRYVNGMRAEGISEQGLIFPVFESETLIGDAFFLLNGKYKVRITKDRRLPNDKFEVGAEYPCLIVNIERRNTGVVIQASRIATGLVEELIMMSLVNCTSDVKVMKVVRRAGEMSKVLVSTSDPTLNSKGVVIGPKGSRIKAAEEYILGEKIEVYSYYDSVPMLIKELIGQSFAVMYYYFGVPNNLKEIKTYNKKKAVVVVDNQNIGRIIGKGGVSLCLTNRLTGWVLKVVPREEFNSTYPDGFAYTPSTFDWTGIDIENDSDGSTKEYYGHYLQILGYNSVAECSGITSDILHECEDLSDGDIRYLCSLFGNVIFVTSCPNCGAEIEGSVSVCPSCGAELEESEDTNE